MIEAKKVLMKVNEGFGNRGFSLDEMKQLLESSLGINSSNATFQNCHGTEFTFNQLIDFFVAKGKLESQDGTYKVSTNFKCGCTN